MKKIFYKILCFLGIHSFEKTYNALVLISNVDFFECKHCIKSYITFRGFNMKSDENILVRQIKQRKALSETRYVLIEKQFHYIKHYKSLSLSDLLFNR